MSGRNKRSVTIDLRQPEGQELARQLVATADVVITNFRPGTLDDWGLNWERLHAVNPKLVMLQVSGFGVESSRRNEPGFGKVGEAMSGVVQITGFEDGPPVHTGFSHADSVTGIFGAFAVQAALYRRSVDPDFEGEWIDMALYESLFRLIEWQVIVHDQLGINPVRQGNRLAVSPAAVINMYRTGDGEWVTVTSGTPKSVTLVAVMLGEQAEDFDTPVQQFERREYLDQRLSDWMAANTTEDALAVMRDAGVVASRIFSMDDIVKDETYAERGNVIEVDDHDLGPVRMQAVLPKMSRHPGTVWRTGPQLGEDNDYVLGDLLGLDEEALAQLRGDGVVG